MKHLLWGGTAQRDIRRIAERYDLVSPGLGQQLLDRIQQAPLALLDFPSMGSPTSRRGVRKWNVRGTPFQLFYTTSTDAIEIRRVGHNRGDGW